MSVPYAAREPCAECPFLKVGGVRLTRERVRDLAGDASFPCHKTCDYDSVEGEGVRTMRSLECAGKLLFHMNVGRFTQMMRIASRLGWNPDAMRGHDRVFGSLAALLRAHDGEPGKTGDACRRPTLAPDRQCDRHPRKSSKGESAMHKFVCESCGKTKTCNIQGCQGAVCVKVCVPCLKAPRVNHVVRP